MFMLSPYFSFPPDHCFSLLRLKMSTCIEWQADFQGQLSAMPRHCRNQREWGKWGKKTCFPITKKGACSTVISRKTRLFSRQRLALPSNTYQGSLSQESKGEEKVEALPVRQRHISGPSPAGIWACQRGEQPGLLQKEKNTNVSMWHTPKQIYFLITPVLWPLGSVRAGFGSACSAARSAGWQALLLDRPCCCATPSCPRKHAGPSPRWEGSSPATSFLTGRTRCNSKSEWRLLSRSAVFSDNQYFSPWAKYLHRKIGVLWFSWWVVWGV